MGKFKHLNVPDQWKQYYTKYPQGYTILESLFNWVQQVDDMVDNVNDWNVYLDNFVEQFDFELQEEVKNTLSEWQDSGLLDVIIDQALQTQIDEVDSRLTTQLAETTTDLSLRGINVMSPPSPFVKAVADGVTDDGVLVNSLIDYSYANGLNSPIIIPEKIGISTTIKCKEGIDLIFVGEGGLIARANVNIIDHNRNVIIKNPVIDCTNVVGFDKAAIFIHGNKYIKTKVQRTMIINPLLWGSNTGYGIHIYSGDEANQAVSFVLTVNPYIHTFYKGIFIESSGVGGTWAKGNTFNNVMMSGNVNDIWVEEEGNIFNVVEIQPQDGIEKENTLYISGNNNDFSKVFLWDSQYGVNVHLTSESKNNKIDVIAGLYPRYVTDKGENNIVLYRCFHSFESNRIHSSQTYDVNRDNFLGMADKRFTVTQTMGSNPTGYTIKNLFRLGGLTRWSNTSTYPVQIEIDLHEQFHNFVAFGVDFVGKNIASSVKIEVYNDSEKTWKEWFSNESNQAKNIMTNEYERYSPFAFYVSKIRFTFSGLTDTNTLEIGKLWAIREEHDSGYVYFTREGGKINGKVLAEDGIGVGNFSQAPTQGAEIGKFRVYDENGTPIGYVPVFDS